MSRSRKSRRTRKHAAPLVNTTAAQTPAVTAASPPQFLSAERIAHFGMAFAFAALAYLGWVNLDWAVFWTDEGYTTYLARNWAEFGAPLADDGRNVLSDSGDGRNVLADGTTVYPPIMPALVAAMFSVFGEGEIQARSISAFFSVAAMAMFALILRHEFPQRRGLTAVAFILACLSPMTLGYARSATYNGLVLFLHMVVFWSYLQFCARKKILHAAILCAASVAAFYTHYLSSLIFMGALAGMHLLFRRHLFDLRAWCIAAVAGAVYAAQVLWEYVLVYLPEDTVYMFGKPNWSPEYVLLCIRSTWDMLSRNDMLAWSVVLWFVVWRAVIFARAWWRRRNCAKSVEMPPSPVQILRDDRLFQYFVFIFIGLAALAVAPAATGVGIADIRYFHSFTPFTEVICAGMVCWAWRALKAAAAVLFGVFLLSDAAGWPFLNGDEHGRNPSWTVPALAMEYHRDYPDNARESFAWIRENVPRDSIFYTEYDTFWMLYHLSDHVRVCCRLSRAFPAHAQFGDRPYLFREDVGAVMSDGSHPLTPRYLYLRPSDTDRQLESFRLRHPGPVYRRVVGYPRHDASDSQRPEPQWHASRPDLLKKSRYASLLEIETPRAQQK